MTITKLLSALILTLAIFSCQEGEETYADTFNIDELEDSPESNEDFIKKYAEYLKNTIDLYGIEDADIIEANSNLTTGSDGLRQSMEFEFEYAIDDFNYFAMNSLNRFHDLDDVENGWDLGEDAFWPGVMGESLQEGNFREFRNSEMNSIGDYSEYSELPLDGDVMIIFHVKWRKLTVYYSQMVEEEMVDQYVAKTQSNFEQIKKAYNKIHEDKKDELVDKALEDFIEVMN